MTHPALDPAAVERFKRRIGRGAPEAVVAPAVASPPATDLVGRARLMARRAATPVVARFRLELVRASSVDQEALWAELAALRDELDRTRAAHAAELAVLHEQLADQEPLDG